VLLQYVDPDVPTKENTVLVVCSFDARNVHWANTTVWS